MSFQYWASERSLINGRQVNRRCAQPIGIISIVSSFSSDLTGPSRTASTVFEMLIFQSGIRLAGTCSTTGALGSHQGWAATVSASMILTDSPTFFASTASP